VKRLSGDNLSLSAMLRNQKVALWKSAFGKSSASLVKQVQRVNIPEVGKDLFWCNMRDAVR
jgi:hypothetical protein